MQILEEKKKCEAEEKKQKQLEKDEHCVRVRENMHATEEQRKHTIKMHREQKDVKIKELSNER